MDNFTFQNQTKIIFGRGAEEQAGAEAALFGRKVLLHSGGGSARRSGLYDRVVASLKAAGMEVVELPGVQPNPRLSLVREGIRLCREQGVQLVLALGGGSVIDSAKAIAIGAPYTGDVWDFFCGKATPAEALPVGAVLTIPAAGSESSKGSVITNEEGWFKRPANHLLLVPRFAILNPELAYTLPAYQVGCGASDILAHLMERYFTNTPHVELSDRLIEATFKTMLSCVPKVLAQPQDYDAWAEFWWAGTVAHNGLFNAGRLSDWGSHNIEHELSAIYDVAHGAGLAVVFPAWMKYVFRHDLARFAQFAVRVWNVEQDFWSAEQTALEGIARYEAFLHGIGMPTRLGELEIGPDRLEEMAGKATAGDTAPLGSFVSLGKKDVLEVLRLAGRP